MTVVLPGHRPRGRCRAQRRQRHRQSARRRLARAAQGLRRADRGARRDRRSALAAGDRRRSATRSPDTARALEPQIARLRLADRVELAGAGRARAAGRALRRGRSVRAAVALRGLRHGLYRGDRARPAGGRDHARARSRKRCRQAPASWCRRTMSMHLDAGADAADRQSVRARAACRRRARCGGNASDLGGRRPAVRASAGRRRHERLLRPMACVARALRSTRARNAAVLDALGGRVPRAVVDLGGRSRLRHRLDLAGAQRAPAGAAELAAGRQRSRPARAAAALGTAAGRRR